jgi:hypothetical protein
MEEAVFFHCEVNPNSLTHPEGGHPPRGRQDFGQQIQLLVWKWQSCSSEEAIFFTAKGGRESISRLRSHVWKRKNFSPKEAIFFTANLTHPEEERTRLLCLEEAKLFTEEAIFSNAKLPHPKVVKISVRRVGKALME